MEEVEINVDELKNHVEIMKRERKKVSLALSEEIMNEKKDMYGNL